MLVSVKAVNVTEIKSTSLFCSSKGEQSSHFFFDIHVFDADGIRDEQTHQMVFDPTWDKSTQSRHPKIGGVYVYYLDSLEDLVRKQEELRSLELEGGCLFDSLNI